MIHDLVKSGDGGGAYALWGEGMQKRQDPLNDSEAITRTMWERITTAAERYNQRLFLGQQLQFARDRCRADHGAPPRVDA